ncbi:L-histidine N(alpha)-methyltransferase [Gordonia sp. HY285]|uniref:L-histidine N(alpha)-methyltransferase n=1 Tax=Gordonia liuliyuniae TaxID=2911517 RepID=UPI001F0301AF|nr:L-histidine N(alpha)-methyltransferase [Gordonia liuliyuniae]MCF8610520.1 L-histidine N(alpha)-methyltransferase [Gordonia liuliyuniae]
MSTTAANTTVANTTVAVDHIVAGLWDEQPALPARWLYDERGSKLFDEITRVPEYYPTRRETAILRDSARSIVAASGASTIVELGSGTSTKTRLLLDEVPVGATYAPVDVSAEVLSASATTLAGDYPGLEIVPIEADFTTAEVPMPTVAGRRLVAFLGGTIGNFDEDERTGFLARLAASLSPGDSFLLGTDLIKDTGRLTAAYNDKGGVTADFNRNVIEALRTQMRAEGLYADDFDHLARWNPTAHRIEMRLRARRDVNAYFPSLDRHWRLRQGAELLTEISVKFTRGMVAAEVEAAGFTVSDAWSDPFDDFLLTLCRKEPRMEPRPR